MNNNRTTIRLLDDYIRRCIYGIVSGSPLSWVIALMCEWVGNCMCFRECLFVFISFSFLHTILNADASELF